MIRRIRRNSIRILAALACSAAATIAPRSLWADDKNGVSPTTISRPSGPGSLEGLGDAFQPALNTGTAQYTVNFALPDGIAGFTPGLSLRYDSGRGFGPAGIGWSFGPGGIRRQTEKGLPRYVDPPAEAPDRFLGMNAEELVPLANDYYLAKIEGAFIRYRRVSDHWEAHTKGGTNLEFGLTTEARLTDSTGTKIYQWYLERQTDTNGNVIEYDYIRPNEEDRQVYLSEIRYGPGSPPWSHYYAVTINYEDRPDPRTDYRSGFKVRSTKRISQVDVKYDDTLIRRYILGYGTHEHWSLLTTITQYGDDGVSTLPVTTFGYATFDLGDPEVPISASEHVIGSTGEPGFVVDNAKVDLIDINADGLPDLLITDAGHLAYLNRGVREVSPGQSAVLWDSPVDVTAEDSRAYNFELSDSNVHLADMTGDGIADLVITETDWVEYFPNVGQVGWAVGQLMSVEHSPPPAPFGPDGDSVLTSDLDFDKRIDVIKSDSGAYSVWFNLGGGAFSNEMLTNGAWHGQQFIDFADPGVQLADMNGDRLNDVVKVTPISVVYCANMGFGQFDQYVEIMLPDRWLDDSPGGNLHRAQLTDVNGDGLADLVVERAEGNDLWFWLNLGNNTLALSRVITDLPATSQAVTRWVDLNGNGTTDLVYADSTLPDSRINTVDLGVLIAGSPHLNALTGIANGYGRNTIISYRSTTDFAIDAAEAGHPWSNTVPFPVAVVAKTQTSIGLDLDGFPDEGPDGDVYLSDFVYRDGYYDPLEKQFRGFAFVKEIQHGDERFGGMTAPTLVTRHAFHTGAPDGRDNDGDSETDEYHEWNGREEEPLKGVELWRETCALPDDPTSDGHFAHDSVVFERVETTWTIRDLCMSVGGTLVELLSTGYQTADAYDRGVRQAVATNVQRSVVERLTNPVEHKHLETRADVDPLGNKVFDWNLGDLDNPADDLYTGYEYARNEAGWIVDRVSRTFQRKNDADGAFVSDLRNYYDGEPFQGLPLGEIGVAGHLHRSESLISGGDVPELTQRSFLRGDPRDPTGVVDTQRQQFDQFGNPVAMLDASAALGPNDLPDGNGHERRIEYDTYLHKFPVRETVVLGGAGRDLEVTAQHHYGFGTPVLVTDFNGNVTNYTYDTFGRLEKEIQPGDDPSAPTHTYMYDLGAPVSSIATIAHTHEGNSPDVVSRQFFDGLGRRLGTFEVGGPVMKGVNQYDPRGQTWKVFQPYYGEPLDESENWLLPDSSLPATFTTYDATGRALEVISPPDAHGIISHATTEYRPLTVVQYDGEDNNTVGPHADTPKTLISDGLGRLIEVHEIETLSPTDSGEFITRYRYALPDLLAEIEDSNGNIKYMRYDGLGRRIFMNDCDRGHTIRTYDAVGNLLSTVDAKNQQIDYTYDGVNRVLTEDYLDSGNPLSLERTPDITYHYDRPSPDYSTLRNLRGKFSWVEDLTGAEFHGFDARGNRETVIKRITQVDGGTKDWATVTLSDGLGRVYQTVYPDGGVVRYRYDARGLLEAIPGFVEELTYHASGQKATCTFANGVTTSYSYDPRQRLTHMATESAGEYLQDLSYDYDQVSNVLGITDGRTLPPADPRNQTASFLIDNTYRLTQAIGIGYGTIEYDYDRLGNMTWKTSPDILDPDVNLGDMVCGGAGGTQNRVGRQANDPPGPHALTSAFDGQRLRTYLYDDNGNMISNDGDEYFYDLEDRLGKVVKDERNIRYLYDYSGRRVIKRVDGTQTTYINKLSEIRDDALIKYVFAGRTRVARVEGPIPPPLRVTQRLSLVEGWNLVSFQVEPDTTDPATILADINGKYNVVYGHDGTEYTCFEPFGGDHTLTALAPNHGYWIDVTEPAELLIEGPISETPVNLSGAAPLLIGFPGVARWAADELQSQYPSILDLWAYVGGETGWAVCDLRSPDYLNTLSGSQPTVGYWVTSDDDTTLNVPSPTLAVNLYYHGDHLGSTSLLTNAEGHLVRETAYYPFGMQRYEDSSEPTGFDPYYGFTDKERDEESGLQYFGARYYGSVHGRFSQVDPLLVEDPDLTRPQGLNLYAFAYNQPLAYTDPTGMEPVRTMFNPPELNAAQRAAMARDTAYLRDIGYLPPHESAGLKSGPSARASSTGARSGRGLQVRIDEIYASIRSEPAYVPGVEDVVAKTVEVVAAGSESRTEYGGIRTAAGEYLIWGEGDLIDIQTEIGGVDPTPPEDIYAEIEAAAGFRDVDITVSDLPMFMETSPHQVEHGKFGGMNQRRGTYTRDPTRYYLETGKAPTGYTEEEIRSQIEQQSAAEQKIIGQMYAD